MLAGVVVIAGLLADTAVEMSDVIEGVGVGSVTASLVTGVGTTAVKLLDCAIEETETAGTAVVSKAESVERAASLDAVLDVCGAVEMSEAAVVDRIGAIAAVLLVGTKLITELASVEVVGSEARIALDVIAGLGETGVIDAELLVSELATAASVPEMRDELIADNEDDTIAVGSVDTAVESFMGDAGAAELEATELVATTVVESTMEGTDAAGLEAGELVAVTSAEINVKLSVDNIVETPSVAKELENTSVERTMLV